MVHFQRTGGQTVPAGILRPSAEMRTLDHQQQHNHSNVNAVPPSEPLASNEWPQHVNTIRKSSSDGRQESAAVVHCPPCPSSQFGGSSGSKCKHGRAAVKAATKALPIAERRRHRHLVAKISTPTTTLFRVPEQEQIFFSNASSLKPKPNAAQKHLRTLHCLERIDPLTIPSRTEHVLKHVDQHDEVHVDEKRFVACNDGESHILVANEEEAPKRAVNHKSHVTKLRFVSAIAKPRRLSNGTWRDGKIGV